MFISNLTQTLGCENIARDFSELESYSANTCGYVRSLSGVLYPRNHDDVIAIVNAANQHSVSLFPICTGKNWGFGSALPVRQDNYIVDLSRHMNCIRHVDAELGIAIIEPGVTQMQLSKHLEQIGAPFFVDVTGSGTETSIVGNTLERGVGFNCVRADDLINFDIVLGTGESIKTGFGHFDDSAIQHICAFGVGPDMNGMFLQSNYGIVTAMTIRLHRHQKRHELVVSFLRDENKIGAMVEQLRELKQKNILNAVIHVFNQDRLNLANERTFSTRVLASNPWVVVTSISSSATTLAPMRREVVRSLRGFGAVVFLSARSLKVVTWICRAFRLNGPLDAVTTLSGLYGLTCGCPTDMAIAKLCKLKSDIKIDNQNNLDQSKTGLLFLSPMTPMRASDVHKVVDIVKAVAREEGVKIPHTFMMSNDKVFANVIMLVFDRDNAHEASRYHRMTDRIRSECGVAGYTPYRVDINNMDEVVKQGSAFWRNASAIKQVLDPNNVIAPGRYAF